MATLSPKTERDTIGIDSFPRAIAYSAFLLRSIYLNKDDLRIRDTVQINPVVEFRRGNVISVEASLNIRASFEFNNSILNSMSDYFSSLILTSGNPIYTGTNVPMTEDDVALSSPDPSYVTSLEGFFLWSVFEYQRSILENNLLDLFNAISITDRYNGTTETHRKEVSVRIPFNYYEFIRNRSYIGAIGSMAAIDYSAVDFDNIFIDENVTVDENEQFNLRREVSF